ncbi:DUF1707 domain-containing protein [Nocardioides sp.]|uniref:DUF1707 domain-containing protein n=1 Tax=Nocardioides sp. TaxID=35761 RepID=UPI003782F826
MRDDQLRIGDVEREEAAAELAEHYVRGRLTTDEHAERLDRVWAARTRGELAPVFADLPGPRGPAGAARPPVRRGPPWTPPVAAGLRVPVLALLVLLGVATVLTHVPLVLAGLLVVLLVAARRRRWAGRPRGWHGARHWYGPGA